MLVKSLLKNADLLIEKNFVNNEWIDADNSETLQVFNPIDQSIIGYIPKCQQAETLRAVEAAQSAWPAWRTLTSIDRSHYLRKWADLIEANLDDLSIIMTFEHGKPLSEARGEIQFGINIIRWFAEQGRRAYGEIIPANQTHHRILIMKQPIGVVGVISPWNFPMATFVRKVSPALAAGCTVVGKPAELTPFSALALTHLAKEAGFPAGIFNIVTGDAPKIGSVLTSHVHVRSFSFTGSTAVGKLLQKQCADTVKKVTLELGGNSPLIVFEDADIELAIKGAMASKFRNMGQTCVCANRIYVHENVYKQFLSGFLRAVKTLKLGNGLEVSVTQGPLINDAAVQKVRRLIDDAVAKGAKIICGGKVSKLGSTFFEPTIITDANENMAIYHEEIFGPVAVIYKFTSEEEVIKEANNTPYGLASYVFTNDIQRMFRVSENIEAGVVSINEGIATTEVTPFGGYKESGNGREGGKEGLDEFLEIKYVCIGNIHPAK